MMANCTVCGKGLHKRNQTGICRECFRTHRPDHIRKRQSDAVKRVYAERPEYREKHRKAMAARARSPEHRQRASERAKSMRIWEMGHKAITPEIIEKRRARISATRLAHIPADYRDQYRHLVSVKHLRAAEAERIVLEQQEADRARWRKEWAR